MSSRRYSVDLSLSDVQVPAADLNLSHSPSQDQVIANDCLDIGRADPYEKSSRHGRRSLPCLLDFSWPFAYCHDAHKLMKEWQ